MRHSVIMTSKSTPPREVLNELPDYFLGCLIYYDQKEGNSMRWICYDGRTKYRCASRSAAESCARNISGNATDIEVGHLLTVHHFLTRAWRAMDKAAAESDVETRLWLELKAVETRKLADALDTLISQKIKSKSKL